MEFVTLGGYGQFVWPAFIFTFICCFALYLKTMKDLKKQEKIFLLKSRQLPETKIRISKPKKLSKEVLSTGLTY